MPSNHRMMLTLLVFAGITMRNDASAQSSDTIVGFLRSEIDAGHVVGAQVLVSSLRSPAGKTVALGYVAPDKSRPVTAQTVFCVGSCSKPVVSALVFTLLDRKQLRLDQRAGDFIPRMHSLKTVTGESTQSPTLHQLLTHRGGIYSQKNNLNQRQVSAIRDYSKSLEESVGIIANEPLTSIPGSSYAYSGAGYCIVGLIAEKAGGGDVESLLQGNICRPLKMTATTYFPIAHGCSEIATGGGPDSAQPHLLGERHKLPLIGGSLYTTTNDFERFARMILSRGQLDRQRVLSNDAFVQMVSPAVRGQDYGFGWYLAIRRGKVVELSHGGSLPPYQAAFRVNSMQSSYKIVFWTLASPADANTMNRIRGRITSLLRDA